MCVCCARCSHGVPTVACQHASCGETVVLLLLAGLVVMGGDPNITDVTQKRLCCNALGEASAGLWNLLAFEDFQVVVCDQLLYEQVFEFNVFCFL